MKTPAARKPKTKAPAIVVNPKPEKPKWWEKTPGACDEYELVMWRDGAAEQAVYMTREEYVILKGHLAKMRGLEFTDPDYDQEAA
jgi:hypothetical protein